MCLAGESDPPPECEALFGRTDGPIPITLDVVGIVRTGTDVTGIANDFAVITVTPGFYEHYHGRIGEEANLVPVRLREGATPEQFARELDAIRPDGVEVDLRVQQWPKPQRRDRHDGLLAHGVRARRADRRRFRRRSSGVAATPGHGRSARDVQCVWHDTQIARGPGRAARAAGGDWQAACSVRAAHGSHPNGSRAASRVRGEPDPGIDFDAVVVLGGTLLLAAAMFALTVVGAWRRTRSPRDRHAPRTTAHAPIGVRAPAASDRHWRWPRD